MNCGKCGQPLTKAKEEFVLAGGPCLCARCSKEWSKKTSSDGPVKDLPLDVNGVSFFPEVDQVQKKPDFLAKCMNIPMVSFAKGEVEGVAELICDHYCKFPELIKKDDILHRICEGCPLNALMTHIQGGSKDD